MLVYMDGGQQD